MGTNMESLFSKMKATSGKDLEEKDAHDDACNTYLNDWMSQQYFTDTDRTSLAANLKDLTASVALPWEPRRQLSTTSALCTSIRGLVTCHCLCGNLAILRLSASVVR